MLSYPPSLLGSGSASDLVARGDGSAEALRSFVPERIPDPLSRSSSGEELVVARDLAYGQKNAVLRRGSLAPNSTTGSRLTVPSPTLLSAK
jgi:hypothetical protein